jgi:hypothetical protein
MGSGTEDAATKKVALSSGSIAARIRALRIENIDRLLWLENDELRDHPERGVEWGVAGKQPVA